LIWLGVHILNLMGFRNRLLVLINWAWHYLFCEYGVRLITPSPASFGKESPAKEVTPHHPERVIEGGG
jgi:NADH dehydrogenase